MSAGENLSAVYEQPYNFNDTVKHMDNSREIFFDASLAYIQNPSRANFITVAHTVGQATLLLERAVRLTITDQAYDLEERANIASWLIVNEDSKRVKFLNEYAPGEYTTLQTTPNEFADMALGCLEIIEDSSHDKDTIEECLAALLGDYAKGVEIDMRKLTSNVDKIPRNQLQHYHHLLTEHGRGATKILVGCALATWLIAKKLNSN